jgi:hypothetical protein
MNKVVGPVMIFFLFSACAHIFPPERPVVVEPRPGTKTSHIRPDYGINEKIRALTQMLEKGSLSESDKEIAKNLIVTYKSINKASSYHFTEEEYDKFLYTLLDSLSIIYKYSFYTQQEKTGDHSGPISQVSRKRREIVDAYISGDFRGVINSSLEVKRVFGPDAITPEIALLFALALGKEGMREEAIAIGEGVVRELEVMPDPIQLRVSLAELQLYGGERDKALLAYEKLTDTLDEHREILQSLNRKIATYSMAGGPQPQPPHGRTDQMGTIQSEGNDDQLFQKVEELIQEHRFGEARDLLTSKRNEIQSGPGIEVIDKTLSALEVAEQKYLDDKLSLISRNKEALESARKLIEEEKFEEAISRLDEVELKEGEGQEVAVLKKLSVERLINRERNRAAKLFLAARKAQDPVEKEKLLNSSFEILKRLIEEYPSSYLNIKLKSHIKAVEDELNKLGKEVR